MDDVDTGRTPDARPVVRISDPGEVAAALPHLLGFHPHESVVAIGLGGPSGGQVGLTVRADLPPPIHAVPFAADLVRSVAAGAPAAVALVLVSEALDEPVFDGGAGLPHRDLVHALVVTLAADDIPVRDILLVRRGRWWSYDCPHPCCDPGAGTPLPAGVTPLAAATVLTGQVVAGSRDELAARLANPDATDRDAVRAACRAPAGASSDGAGAWRAVQDAVRARRAEGTVPTLPPEVLAVILRGLSDTALRDRALGLALGDDAAAAELLWTECTRRAPFVLAAAPATLLAVSAWLRGDGATASVALDRALGSDEDYHLAHLLRGALAVCVPPGELRAMIAATLDRVDADRPGG